MLVGIFLHNPLSGYTTFYTTSEFVESQEYLKWKASRRYPFTNWPYDKDIGETVYTNHDLPFTKWFTNRPHYKWFTYIADIIQYEVSIVALGILAMYLWRDRRRAND